MDINTARIRELLDRRDEIDRELAGLFAGTPKKAITCSHCNQQGHTSRSCPQKVQST